MHFCIVSAAIFVFCNLWPRFFFFKILNMTLVSWQHGLPSNTGPMSIGHCPNLFPLRTLNRHCVCLCVSHSVWLFVIHGLWPARLLCPWDSPGKNTGVGSCSLCQGIFLTQGSKLGLLHGRQILLHVSHQGTSTATNVTTIQQWQKITHFPFLSDQSAMNLVISNYSRHHFLPRAGTQSKWSKVWAD